MYLQIRSEIGTKLLYFLTYSGRHVADVVLKAGIRGSDQSKDKVINVMPYDLWKGVIRKLKTLTPSDIPTWTLKWARAMEAIWWETKLDFQKDEIERMRMLVLNCGEGSKLYWLRLWKNHIGMGGISAVKAFATVLQEVVKEKVPRCHHLQVIVLHGNDLTDEHMEVLAPVFLNCRSVFL